jgi:acetolactate synthase-1/2/3 large subunit
MPNGAELFVQTISQLGIDRIFTLVGDHLNEVLGVAASSGIRIIDMRHESGVTHAADAWARLTRKPALSLVTGGPGHTNSLTGIATAQLAGSPLIAVSGSRATTVADRGGFQDIDQVGMAKPVVKWAAEPSSASQIPFYLGRAYGEANSGRKGAVHLTIPVDLFTEKSDAPARMPSLTHQEPLAPGWTEVEQATRILREAERPVIIAGSGVWWSSAEQELQEFIEKTSIPVYTIAMARGAVSDEHPLVMGYADPALNRAAWQAFQEADVFLVIGKRIDFRLAMGGPRLFPAGAKFIQIDIHPQELGLNRSLDVGIVADAKCALRALSYAAGRQPWIPLPWVGRVRELKREWQEKIEATAQQGEATPLHPAAFYRELREALPPDVVYSWDGGDFSHWGRVMLPAREPGRWLRLGPLGTIGSALPNAIAMQQACPDRPVVMITGDGSLGFYIAELDTAVRHKLPFVTIVGNDAGWGLERELQQATIAPRTVACELRSTRYDLVMKGFGGEGETIDRIDQVKPAVKRALSAGVPYLLNVNIRGVRSPFTDWQIAGKKRV